MDFKDSVYGESTMYAISKSFFTPCLRPAFCYSVPSIFYNFFLRQYHAAFLPGRIPVSDVDHSLDEKIPFAPSWVTIYLDFTQFWIRIVSFFLRRNGRKAYNLIKNFINSIGDLYAFAAEVYSRNLSTTKRPFYISRPRFFLIHLVDPHLMCIPSLHVMIVIHAYTQFMVIAGQLGNKEKLKDQIEEIKQGARAITQAILFVKQHSVNCIPAALYAMTCFSPELFTPKDAEDFTALLFSPAPKADKLPKRCRIHPAASPSAKINDADQALIKSHILSLYYRFLEERDMSRPWYEPLLKFLRTYTKE
jgi:hypothetical protein